MRAVRWHAPAGQHLLNSDIRSLRTARDGRLWIGTFNGLASWRDGNLTHYPELDGQVIEALLEDREGTIWVAGWAPSAGRLCRIQSGKTQCYGDDGSLGSGITSLYEDSGGNLWAGATSLWRWKPGPPKLYPMPYLAERIYAVAESDDGGILVAKHSGITKLRNGKTEAYPLPAGLQFRPHRLFRDRDGSLWVGAVVDKGLLHVHGGRTDLFARTDGLSEGSVTSLLEDREGNIWVATVDGLDRFRNFAVPTISYQQGLSSRGVFSILPAKDGSFWMGTSDGMNRWNKGQITVYRNRGPRGARGGSPVGELTGWPGVHSKMTVREITDSGLPNGLAESLFQDDRGQIWVGTQSGVAFFASGRFVPIASVPYGVVYGFTEDRAGNVWMSHQEGLFRLSRARVVERITWAGLGRREPASALLHDAVQDGLWLGFRDGGVAYFKDGQLRASYSGAEGLAEGWVRDLYIDGDRTLWASTEGGLSRIKQGRVLTLTSRNGLPCNTVHWMMEDNAHSVWLYLACGLVRIARAEMDAWASHPKQTIQTTIFDTSDGVSSHRFTGGYNSVVAKAADGKLWFLRVGGVSVLDPHNIAFNSLPPPVHIESIEANGERHELKPGMRLPANIRSLRIEYTALSFVAPEKIHFKYKLEGQNKNWHEVINERQATYTNLGPRKYRFRVMASNNSGVWNEAGDTLEFSIAPAYYQTTWFRVLCGAAFLALLGAGYRYRMWQVQREGRQLRNVIETIPAFVWSAEPDGSVDFTNRRFLQFSGFTAPEALGWGWANALHPEDRGGLVERWLAAVASGTPLEAEARMRSTTGEYRWLIFRAVPMQDAAGKIVKWYGKTTDIEEQKRADQERVRLHELEAELAHINRVSMMGELAASVAHEVNQPLTGIVSNGSACLRMLARESSPIVEEVREAIGDIVRDGKRAGEVISRIRAMTKRAALPRERVDVNQVIREVLVLVGDEAKKRSVVVRTHLADDVSPVFADRIQLQQVVLNLVMNAMDAMSGVTGRQRELVIHTRNMEDGHVEVTVDDSGVGLDPKAMSKIFDPFYTTKASGMGMGLSICRSIVQNHGGRLWATANERPGTSFHFTVPTHSAEGKDAGSAVV